MYRKHQRMEVERQFIQRVANLPVVTSAVGQVVDVYSRTKEFSPILKYTIETAESAVKYGSETAKPLVNKLEKPISFVNDFACGQLTKLETNYPIITKPPAEIVQSSKNVLQDVKTYGVNKVNNVKQYGQEKVNNVKNYGIEKANYIMASEVGKVVINRADDLFTIAENLLDNYLPPVECDDMETSKNQISNNSVQRLVTLSSKAHFRVRCHALLKIGKLRNKALERVEELKALLILMKDKTLSSVKSYNGKVQNIIRELTKEEEEHLQAQNWQDKLLQQARVLTKSLVYTFKQASYIITYSSTLTKQRFLEARDLADSLYTTFKTVSGTGEISDTLVSYTQETLQKLQDFLLSLGSLIPALNKIVPLSKTAELTNDLSSDNQHMKNL